MSWERPFDEACTDLRRGCTTCHRVNAVPSQRVLGTGMGDTSPNHNGNNIENLHSTIRVLWSVWAWTEGQPRAQGVVIRALVR